MLTMDKIYDIRRRYYEKGEIVEDIVRQTKHDRKTINKYLDMTDFNESDPKAESEYEICPKLDSFKETIDGWLIADKQAPRKQRHTAKRVYDRLSVEEETKDTFDCSYRLVAQYVAEKKKELSLSKQSGFIPLKHYPGESQADFGAARFYEDETQWDGKYLTISFPFSNHGFTQLNYGENVECLFEGLIVIFEHIGGVPTEIWFDNTSTIVTEIIKGGGRTLTEKFLRFQEHYGFKAVFVAPSKGNEKGSVENKIGYSRRNFMVPIPHFVSLRDYNKELLEICDEDGNREHYRLNEDISELFDKDRENLRPLPETPFDPTSLVTVKTNGWGKFTMNGGRHEYSVTPGHSNSHVYAKLSSANVIVLDMDFNEIVTHRRLYGDEKQEEMNWLPYLRFVAGKPRSLFNSGIYDMLPQSVRKYLTDCGNKNRGDILRALSALTDHGGFENAVNTVEQAIMYEAKDADSLRNLYRRLYSEIPELPPLLPQEGIPEVEYIPADLKGYDDFLKAGDKLD